MKTFKTGKYRWVSPIFRVPTTALLYPRTFVSQLFLTTEEETEAQSS